jgi:hypothetical protein
MATPANASLPAASQTAGKKKPFDVIKDSWMTSSIPQKAILLMMPFAFVAMFVIFQDEEQVTEVAHPAASVASAAASAPVASATTPPVDTTPPPAPDAAVVDTTADASAPGDASAAPKLAKGEKTLQREAADALASGSNVKALELYEKLAKENPNNEAYAGAVRILRDRATGGAL